MTKKETNLEEKIKLLFSELESFEKQSGIFEKAEKIREGSFMYYPSDAPLFSDQRKIEIEKEINFEQSLMRKKIRKLYFSVSDTDLRKILISKDREISKTILKKQFNEIQREEKELSKLQNGSKYWIIVSSITSMFFIYLGNELYSNVGALIGASIGIFYGIQMKYDEINNTNKKISQVKENIVELKKTYSSDSEYNFTDSEAISGEEEST